jgi:hypothetical protein
MEAKFLWLILQEIDSLFLSIAVISILFFFFFAKVRFQKRASLRAYGILFYAFIFYAISAMSYVFLNAMDSFFRLTTDLYSSFLWFFPFGILSAIIGAFIGWLIYIAGSKTAGPFVFKLMNLSLLVIAPFLLYSLLVQPVIKTMDMALQTIAPAPINKEVNAKEFQEIDKLIAKLKAKDLKIAYSKTDGYSSITKDNKHVRFLTKEEDSIVSHTSYISQQKEEDSVVSHKSQKEESIIFHQEVSQVSYTSQHEMSNVSKISEKSKNLDPNIKKIRTSGIIRNKDRRKMLEQQREQTEQKEKKGQQYNIEKIDMNSYDNNEIISHNVEEYVEEEYISDN